MKSFITLLLFLTALPSFSQSFQGTVTYVTDFTVSQELANMGMTKDMLREQMIKEGSWSDTIWTSYKEGNYYTMLNNNPNTWSVYRADSNKIYSFMEGEDICSVTDASVDVEFTLTGKMPLIQKLDTTVMIDGAACNIVRVKWNAGVYDYYYNPLRLNIDASLFSKHVYDGFGEFLKLSDALPVKIVKSLSTSMTMTFTLVSSSATAISNDLFKLPTLVPDPELNLFNALGGTEFMQIKR